jgi:single-strand DNA-binding protein
MRDLNKVMLIGNLTRDPELRTTAGGQSVVSFAIALNRNWNDAQGVKQEAVEYVDITIWGKLGEIANQYAAKGRRVYIEGRLQTNSWEAQDGTKRQKTEVVASDLILLDRAPAGAGAERSAAPAATEDTRQPVAQTGSSEPSNSEEINIEDIPF